MDKHSFKLFCNNEFKSRGFNKCGNMFYRQGTDVMCGLLLQKSEYDSIYYINYYFFVGIFDKCKGYPSRYDFDIFGRIKVISKTQNKIGKAFMTSQIEYEEYEENELREYFDKEFEQYVLPPILHGKKHILDNLNKKYFLTLREDEVIQKLNQSGDG